MNEALTAIARGSSDRMSVRTSRPKSEMNFMNTSEKITAADVAAFLEDRARHLAGQAPVFYGDVAAHFGLPPVTEAWSAHPLSSIVDELDNEDAKRSRPFRTALVLSEDRSIPG